MIVFSYVIVSEQDEKQLGRVVLQPHTMKRAGATFRAGQLARALLDNIVILGKQDANSSGRPRTHK